MQIDDTVAVLARETSRAVGRAGAGSTRMIDHGLGSWPRRRARMRGDTVALQQGERSLTYDQLTGRVEALSAALAARGIQRGDRVAYLGPNDIATFETFFAAASLGAIFVPLNIRLAPPEIAYLLDDCAPSLLMHAGSLAELTATAGPTCPTVEVGGDDSAYAELLLSGRTSLPFAERAVALDDDAVILYTSGTTGRSKGAVLTHANLTFNVVNQLAHLDVLSTDVALCTSPLFHVTGLGQISLPALFKGATVVVAPAFDAGWMLHAISELKINAFSAVPTMLQMLCDHPDFDTADLSSLRYVNFGGSPVAERVATAWLGRGVPLVQGFGMTETSPGVFMAMPDGAADRPSSAGVAHFFTDVALLAPDGTLLDPPGEGEVLVKGPTVFRGYFNRPDETEEAFTDGWFRSGDVARVADDEWAYIVGRVKDMLISGGENIYAAEVEALIDCLPEVTASALIGVPDPSWGEVGMACVVLAPGATLTLEDLRERLSGQLARYKLPRHLRIFDELPRTATGKIQKHTLRQMNAASTSGSESEGNSG